MICSPGCTGQSLKQSQGDVLQLARAAHLLEADKIKEKGWMDFQCQSTCLTNVGGQNDLSFFFFFWHGWCGWASRIFREKQLKQLESHGYGEQEIYVRENRRKG